jgi:hypothetical protein
MDMPDRMTQEFEGPGMVSRVDQVMGVGINGDDGEEVQFVDSGIPSPYLQYAGEATAGGPTSVAMQDERTTRKGGEARPKKKDKGSYDQGGAASGGTSRPKSAAKRRDEGAGGARGMYEEEYKLSQSRTAAEDNYPTARGLVRK